MREGVSQPLSQQEVATVSAAGKAYAHAVEDAQEPAHASDVNASIGSYLRRRWAEVGPPWHHHECACPDVTMLLLAATLQLQMQASASCALQATPTLCRALSKLSTR